MTNNRTRPVMEKNPKSIDTDDSQEETTVQPMNAGQQRDDIQCGDEFVLQGNKINE